jgi:hypothetical protein
MSKMYSNPISQPLSRPKTARHREWTPTYADGLPRPNEPMTESEEEFWAMCVFDEDDDPEFRDLAMRAARAVEERKRRQ